MATMLKIGQAQQPKPRCLGLTEGNVKVAAGADEDRASYSPTPVIEGRSRFAERNKASNMRTLREVRQSAR